MPKNQQNKANGGVAQFGRANHLVYYPKDFQEFAKFVQYTESIIPRRKQYEKENPGALKWRKSSEKCQKINKTR